MAIAPDREEPACNKQRLVCSVPAPCDSRVRVGRLVQRIGTVIPPCQCEARLGFAPNRRKISD